MLGRLARDCVPTSCQERSMSNRFIVFLVVTCVVVSGLTGGLVGWVAAVAVSPPSAGSVGPQGDEGTDGTPGIPGPRGSNGANGANGGASTGATGPQGLAGAVGPAGAAGAAGAAISSYSHVEASGAFPELTEPRTTQSPLAGPPVAGPALTGFAISIETTLAAEQVYPCTLVDQFGTAYVSSSYAFANTSSYSRLSAIGLVNLPANALLTLSCQGQGITQEWVYAELSIFVIPFTP
jgi:hypothetical protein